jgi:E1A/CREB-binding protein
MVLLYELHTQGQDKFVYTCNNCSKSVETRYHCTVCDDFDLCIQCFTKDGHPHKMEKLGFDLDGSKCSNSCFRFRYLPLVGVAASRGITTVVMIALEHF